MFCSTPILRPRNFVDRAHPLGVPAGQVVVDGHQVDALAAQGVEDDCRRRRQRLALAGLHLGDRARVQDHAADHLHVEVAHVQRAPARLADDRERLGQQLVERLALLGPLAQGGELRAQLVVVHQLELALPGVDLVDALGVLPELLAFAQAQGAIEDGHRLRVLAPRPVLGPGRQIASDSPSDASGTGPAAAEALCSRRLRRLSRWRFTWRVSSSATRLIERRRSGRHPSPAGSRP